MECGHNHYEQHDIDDDRMMLVCLVCGHRQMLRSYREEGEDKWEDDYGTHRRGR